MSRWYEECRIALVTTRTVTLVLGLAGMLFLAPRCASMLRMHAATQHPIPLKDVDEVASRARLRFPPGSRLIESEWRGALNTHGYARVELPSDRIDEFLSQPSFHGRYERSDGPVPEGRNPVADNPLNPTLLERWRLSHVRRSILARAGELNSPVMPLGLFIDLDDPKQPVAYLHWYD